MQRNNKRKHKMVDNARQLLDELMGRNRNALGKTEILNCFDTSVSFFSFHLKKMVK